MTISRKVIASIFLMTLVGSASPAQPGSLDAGGTVTHLNGTLYARKASGVVKVLSAKSLVEQGDLLVTGKATYARIQFAQDTELTLGPDSQLDIERFSFDQQMPANDRAVFKLIRGQIRSVAGQLGRNADAVQLVTPLGTLDIGAATVIVDYVVPTKTTAASASLYRHVILAAVEPRLVDDRVRMTDAPWDASIPLSSEAGEAWGRGLQKEFDWTLSFERVELAQTTPNATGLAPGLYVHVIDGIINLSNKGGSLNFSAGQFGYTASIVRPPVVVPNNPGIQFSPPPSFSSSSALGQSGSGSGKSNAVDCEVR